MKVKAFLVKNPEIYDARMKKIFTEYPELQEKIKKGWNPRETYIELNTGGLFDDLSPDSQKALEKWLASFLSEFGELLLTAIGFDSAILLQKGRIMPGTRAIQKGLEEIKKQLKVARTIAFHPEILS